MTSTRPFRAFVSYCHADRGFAAQLQRRLEAYRLPRRLAGQVAPLPGQSAGRIGPIFRDRADLSAATDLSRAVRDAIAASSALVVVASPDAVRSKWVDREIILFRTLHPGAPILVAHAREDPVQSLPEALRSDGSEPLAADFRREGDGPRLAFLKIVAGLARLPLDTLVQRDAQRRLRRVTAVTLGALAVALLMAAATVLALAARAQAVRERSQAEGLVEFMLTDLRTELRGVGRLDVMRAAVMRAQAYYTDQGDIRRLPDESRLRYARVLHARGEDEGDMGRPRDAQNRFEQAYAITAPLLAGRPGDPARIFAHAQSAYWLGNMALTRKMFVDARRYFEQYAALARKLVAADPRKKDWQMEVGYAESNLGTVATRGDKRPDLAQAAFERAGVHFETARRLAPGDLGVLRDLADNYGWLADSLYDQGKFDQAHVARSSERALIETLAAHAPKDARLARDRVESSLGLARIEIKLKRSAEAMPLLRRASALIGPLAQLDPENKRTARLQASITLHLASLAGGASPRPGDAPILIAAALRTCAAPDALAGTAEQQRLCEQIRARESGVSTH